MRHQAQGFSAKEVALRLLWKVGKTKVDDHFKRPQGTADVYCSAGCANKVCSKYLTKSRIERFAERSQPFIW